MDETQRIIKEQLEKLPKIIKDAISSVNFGEKIRRIANKNMLHVDQAGNLENETMFVMLGLEPIGDYKENIRRELNISRDRAQAIAAEIDKEIFVLIRESVKNIQNVNNKPDIDTATNSRQKEIHHNDLTHSPSNSRAIDRTEESEDIRQYVEEQNATKSVAEPPQNLPTAPQAVPQDSSSDIKKRPSDGDKDVSPSLEKKKPYSDDPYREPVV